MLQSETRKPLVQSTTEVPHTEVQIPSLHMYVTLWQYPSRAPQRFIYVPEVHFCSGGTFHTDEAHHGLVLSL
jgi:hypothetical protein